MKKSTLLFVAALTVTGTANAQWNTDKNPIVVYDNGVWLGDLKVARTTDGKTFIAWDDMVTTSFNLYLQLLDADGNRSFGDDALTVDSHATAMWASDFSLVADADDNAILSFADARSEEDDEDVTYYQAFQPVFYKVDQDANFVWGTEGVTFSDVIDAAFTGVSRIGDDIYIKWQPENEDSIVFNRIAADGTLEWEENKSLAGQMAPCVGTDFIVVSSTDDGTMAQRYTRDYAPVWDSEVCLSQYPCNDYAFDPYKTAADGNGGLFVAFTRDMGSFSHMITTQHIGADGTLAFGTASVDTYNTEDGDHDYCKLAVDQNTGRAFVTWAMLDDDGTTYYYRAQQYSANGEREAGDKGWTLETKTSASGYAYTNIGAGAVSNGDWIVAYTVDSGWSESDLFIARYDQEGNLKWKQQIGETGDFSDAVFIVEEECSYIVYENDFSNIMAARIYNDGKFIKVTDGISSTTDTTVTEKARYTVDGKAISTPQKGLNIVRMSDGTVKKVFVR